MLFSRFFGEEQACCLDHDVSAHFAPLEVGWVTLSSEADFFAVDYQGGAINRHVTVEAAMHAVVLEHVGQVVWL